MTHTEYSSVLAQAIVDKLELNRGVLGLQAVYYGNQNKIPFSPSAVVICGRKRRTLVGAAGPGGRAENELVVVVDIHSAKVNDEATERLALDQLSEAVEKVLNSDTSMGGIIIHGYVHEWDPGESFIGSSMFRSVRLTFVGKTKTNLSA